MMEALAPHVERLDEMGCPIGRDPRQMSAADLEAAGHRKEPLLRLIRRNCIDCAGGSEAEVRRCSLIRCPFWPYRMSTNPFAAERELSEAQRTALATAAAARKRARFSSPASTPATLEAAEAPAGIAVASCPSVGPKHDAATQESEAA